MKECIKVMFVFIFGFLEKECGKGIKRWFDLFLFLYYYILDYGNVFKWLWKKGGEVSFLIYWYICFYYILFM